MKKQSYPKNDGWNDIEYDLCKTKEENEKINHILNEATHVFHLHAEGTWSDDKQVYAKQLLPYIENHPSLIDRLLKTEDRVIKMLTYKAIELSKNKC